jgi:hypothetical protein
VSTALALALRQRVPEHLITDFWASWYSIDWREFDTIGLWELLQDSPASLPALVEQCRLRLAAWRADHPRGRAAKADALRGQGRAVCPGLFPPTTAGDAEWAALVAADPAGTGRTGSFRRGLQQLIKSEIAAQPTAGLLLALRAEAAAAGRSGEDLAALVARLLRWSRAAAAADTLGESSLSLRKAHRRDVAERAQQHADSAEWDAWTSELEEGEQEEGEARGNISPFNVGEQAIVRSSKRRK